MAYPLRVLDFTTDKEKCEEFLYNLYKDIHGLCPDFKLSDDLKLFHRWDCNGEKNKLPSYLHTLATDSLKNILKDIPDRELRWKGTLGIYGRKSGCVIKNAAGINRVKNKKNYNRKSTSKNLNTKKGKILNNKNQPEKTKKVKSSDTIVYRLVLHLGDPEVYYVCGTGDTSSEPLAMSNGMGIIFSPQLADNVNIKVQSNPFRKNLPKDIHVPKIRSKEYSRITIVLDLPIEDLTPAV